MGNRGSREAGAGDGSSSAAGLPAAAAAAAGGAPHPGAAAGQAPPPECPASPQFKGQVYKNPAVYNVYNQRINDPAVAAAEASPLSGLPGQDVLDPKNNMPLEPNQQPCPGQKRLLSTERQASNIPKGGTESTWVYPSPQMFFNGEPPAETLAAAGYRWHRARLEGLHLAPAQLCCTSCSLDSLPLSHICWTLAALKRKGKGSDVSEEDMDAVVFTHNTMNEITWQQVWWSNPACARRLRAAALAVLSASASAGAHSREVDQVTSGGVWSHPPWSSGGV